MKKLIFLIIIFVFLFIIPNNSFAIYDPTIVSNNHFGMHVVDASDLAEVSKLVNSNGGDWGYVTLVIQKGERDTRRWQTSFDEMRRLHLIPIIRIATAPVGDTWEKPNDGEIDGWVSFLNSLNWVVKNRYVVIGNETNHASEWGGQIDPIGYGEYLKNFSGKLKRSNDDFFIMAGGFDATATNSRTTMDESLYLQRMVAGNPGVFDFISGWASHSYPSPDFSGPGDGQGRGTVRTYEWELSYLRFLGINKEFPVFITETGWTHNTETLTTNIGAKIETAYKDVWKDKRVIAVTPFIFKYTAPPFDTFSWKNKDGQFYDFYQNVLNLPKTKGQPIQEYKADIITGVFPKIAPLNSNYTGVMFIKNTGQSIWNRDNIKLTTSKNETLNINSLFPAEVEPNEIGVFLVSGKFANTGGIHNTNIQLLNNEGIFNNQFGFSTNLIPGLPNAEEVLSYLKDAILRKIGHFVVK